MIKLTCKVERLLKGYPLYSQENIKENDKMIYAKLFALSSSATWWITEYDPASKVAF